MQMPGKQGNRKMQLRNRSQGGRRKTKRLCCHGNQLKKTEEKGRDHLCQIPLMEAGFCELDLALSFTVSGTDDFDKKSLSGVAGESMIGVEL